MTGRGAWAALVAATLAAYGVVVLGVGPALMAAGDGALPFDLRIGGYTRAEAAAYLDRIGAEGRAWYAARVVPADLVFAALCTVALAATARRFGPARGAAPAVILAALPGLCDIAETLSIGRMLAQGPGAPDPALVARASVLTQAKWTAVPVAALVIGLRLWRGRA